MARVHSLKRCAKTIRIGSHTVADYNMDREFFSIWTYRENDPLCQSGCPQNMQFDHTVARDLRDALNIFLGETQL